MSYLPAYFSVWAPYKAKLGNLHILFSLFLSMLSLLVRKTENDFFPIFLVKGFNEAPPGLAGRR